MNYNEATGMLTRDYDGVVIKTPCTVDIADMSIYSIKIEVYGLYGIPRQWFEPDTDSQKTYGLDEKIEICNECHEHLLKFARTNMDGEIIIKQTEGCPLCNQD